jgi:hypothetical protein
LRYQLVQSGAVPPSTTRLPADYALEVASWRTVCDACRVSLRRQRSSVSYPAGLALGQPIVRSVQKQCPVCHRIYRSEEYPEVVPAFGSYCFDLIVEIGLARFLRYRQNLEIQQELKQKWGLQLPCSTISELAQSFLDYLAAVHRAHVPQLRELLQQDGGYALHVDGTCEDGTEILFNAVAGNRGWVLAGCKMATEDATQIADLLRLCMESFGVPLALVRDLSVHIESAHQKAMPGVTDLICQYHFLENVGKKLCEKHHVKLTNCLRRLKIRPTFGAMRRNLVRSARRRKASLTSADIDTIIGNPAQANDLDAVQITRSLAYALLLWVEDYGADLQGEYFPFDLPSLALYHRYQTVHAQLGRMLPTMDSHNQAFPTLQAIQDQLTAVLHDTELVTAVEQLDKAASLFTELRAALRLTGDRCRPLLHQRSVAGGPVLARHCEEYLDTWTNQLKQRRASEKDPDQATNFRVVLDYFERYSGKLTGHVIALPNQAQPFVVQRTNNLSEHRFGRTKQGLRRKLGVRNLSRYLQAMRPEEFLVDNLRCPDYLQIVCGGSLDNLPSEFARNQQAAQSVRFQRKEKTSNHPIPVKRKNLRDKNFLSRIMHAIGQMASPKRAAA